MPADKRHRTHERTQPTSTVVDRADGRDQCPQCPPVLQIRGLTHWFGGLRAVHNHNLDLEEGELVGLIGPNGAGKTTIFNLVTGAYKPTEGEIMLNGDSLVGLRPHQITAKGIGRTFQTIRLWNELTVLDNVRIAHASRIEYGLLDSILRSRRYWEEEQQIKERAMELLAVFGLEEQAQELAKNLPYGSQRRVEIARALTTEPQVLLLDEPAAGMNPGEIGELLELIQQIRQDFGITIWIIEHQMRVIMNICERIKVIDFGTTIAEGTPTEIQNNPKVIKAYLGEEAF
jgi:branched-chain amino acid transport system ATP-binding protein